MLNEDKTRGLLVAVDFSAHSLEALLFAANQADCLKTHLTILHVVHDPAEMPGYYAKLIKKKRLMTIEDMATNLMDEFITDLISQHPGITSLSEATRLLITGLPVPRILEVINQLQPLQVVMGSQGRSRLDHIMLGSKAEQVVRLSPVPVTIVKTPKDKK